MLSTCETGLGEEVKGEGLEGLTHRFMYAGARRVVVSLWNVNDKATAGIGTLYLGMLKNKKTPRRRCATRKSECCASNNSSRLTTGRRS